MALIAEANTSCHEACCTGEQNSCAGQCSQESEFCQETCCAAENQPTAGRCLNEVEPCQDKCCAGDGHSLAEPSPRESVSCQDACCDDTLSMQDGDAQRAHGKFPDKTSEDPPCCAGKPSPCCDKSCLERLAARECEQSSSCGG